MLQPKDFSVEDRVKWRTLKGWPTEGIVKEIYDDHLVASQHFRTSSGLDKEDKRYSVKWNRVMENLTTGKKAE